MATRFILTVAIFQLAIWACYAVSGIIWHKQQQKFVKLFSIPQFAALQEENLAKRRAIEMQDMRGVVVKAVYYEVRTRSKALNISSATYCEFLKELNGEFLATLRVEAHQFIKLIILLEKLNNDHDNFLCL